MALVLGAGAAVALGGATAASAALPAVAGCGFTLGVISGQGALGTEYWSVPLLPDSPVERCTITVITTVSAVPNPALAGAPPRYTDVGANPLVETNTVTFTPGRLAPTVSVGWDAFACGDPAVKGFLYFVVTPKAGSGVTPIPQVGSIPVAPISCALAPAPSSHLEPAFVASDSVVAITATPDGKGYQTVDQLGNANSEGDAAPVSVPQSNASLVAIRQTTTGLGDWIAAADGGVFTTGDAGFYGSAGALHLVKPVVGMAPTPDGKGYWLVASDGGVFNYGDAAFYGSTGAIRLNSPVVAIAPTPDGKGYWLVAADGGIFAFGDATFAGSLGSVLLNAPIVGMAADANGGYWLVASDGGIFTFGGAPFKGSAGSLHLDAPISGMAPTPDGQGYWLVGADGGIFTYGDAGFYGA